MYSSLRQVSQLSLFEQPNIVAASLIVFFLILFIVNLEVSEFIGVAGRRHHPEPIPQVVLLEVLLGQVLEVALGEGHGGGDHQAVLLPGQGDVLAQVAGLASNLDALLEVGLKVSAVHDAVLHRVGAVNGEAEHGLLANLDGASLALEALAPELLLARLLCGFSRHFGRVIGGRKPLLSNSNSAMRIKDER